MSIETDADEKRAIGEFVLKRLREMSDEEFIKMFPRTLAGFSVPSDNPEELDAGQDTPSNTQAASAGKSAQPRRKKVAAAAES